MLYCRSERRKKEYAFHSAEGVSSAPAGMPGLVTKAPETGLKDGVLAPFRGLSS
jgi:hypothetical protein